MILDKSITAFIIIMAVWGISEVVSVKTKSFVSSLFLASMIFLVGYQTKVFPPTMMADSGLLGIGAVLIGFTIVHLGTLISINELVKNWKTVTIALGAVLGILVVVAIVAIPFVGRDYALASVAPISGGTIAAVIMNGVSPELGLFATLIVSFQGFIGYPLATIILRQEARDIVTSVRNDTYVKDESKTKEFKLPRLFPVIPERYLSASVNYVMMALVFFIAAYLDKLSNGYLNKYAMSLLIAIFATEIGYLKRDVLGKSQVMGFMTIAIMVVVFNNLSNASIDLLISFAPKLLIVFAAGISGIFIFSIVIGKLLKYPTKMSIVIGLTCLFGFPGTMILSKEIAQSMGQTDHEKQAIEETIMPKLIIAGFVTVTISSVLIAGIIAGIIGG